MTFETVVMGVFVAVVYAISMYVKKTLNVANPQMFDWSKVISTMIVGGLVGLFITQTGVLPTEVGVVNQMAMMGGLIVATENTLKILWRIVSK